MLSIKQGLSAVCCLLIISVPGKAAVFFGQHVFYPATFSHLNGNPFDGIRLWDSAGTMWRDIEPATGQYDFSRMDAYVTDASAHQLDMIYTLGQTPRWASARPDEVGNTGLGAAAEPVNMDNWSDYVKTVASRYRGKISAYEVMNEPRIPEAIAPYSPGFFSGSTAALIDMTRRTRAALNLVAPEAKVVCPAMDGQQQGVKRLQYFLSHGGGDACDVIGFHFYLQTQTVSEFQGLLAEVRAVMQQNGQGGKPLWDTEIGMKVAQSGYNLAATPSGPGGPIYTDQDAGRRMVKLLLASFSGGVARTYWFAYDSSSMGATLANKTLEQLNVLGVDYQSLKSWLAGSQLGSCLVSDAIGNCTLVRNGQPIGCIVWGMPYTSATLAQAHIRQLSLLNGSHLSVTSLSATQTLAQLTQQFQDPMLLSY
jgi:hypothetical protein